MRLLGSSLALAVGCFYLWLIAREDEGFGGRVWLVYGCLVAAALLLLARRAVTDVVASTLLVAWAVLGSLSIGILLVPSALIAGREARHGLDGRAVVPALAAAVATVAALAVGLRLT